MEMIFSEATRYRLVRDPFPYIHLERALSVETYNALVAELPDLDYFRAKGEDVDQSNRPLGIALDEIAGNPKLGPTIKEFFRIHNSQEWHARVMSIFEDDIKRFYPDVMSGKYDIRNEGNLQINTPTTNIPSTVRGPHLDNRHVLYDMNFYLRKPSDDSKGGDLDVYRYKDRFHGYKNPSGRQLPEDDIENAGTIRCTGNNGIIFLNTINSVHGVSRRHPTSHPRFYFRLNAVTDKPLFLEDDCLTLSDKIKRRAKRIWE
jgi:hypothetical protein